MKTAFIIEVKLELSPLSLLTSKPQEKYSISE